MPHKRVAAVCAAVGVLGTGAAIASAPKSHVEISGPTSVKLGHNFSFKVTGFVASPANKVAVFEDGSKCSKKELSELHRFTSAEIDQAFISAGHHFKRTENLHAVNPGSHYLCAYVFLRVNQANDPHTTYAYAAHKWTNHH